MMKFNSNSFPRSMILFVFFIVVTGASLTLAGQSIDYWLDFSHATANLPWIQSVLTIHPLLFAALTIAYLIGINFFLKRLSGSSALILWLVFCFIHFRSLFFGLSENLDRFYCIECNYRYSVEFGLFIFFSAILGILLARMLRMKPAVVAEMEQHPKKSRNIALWTAVSVSAIWLIALVFGFMITLNNFGTGWRPVVSEHRPDPTFSIEVAYDENRQTAVIFGGEVWSEAINNWDYINDTWEWDGVDWVQKFPKNIPPVRAHHTMVFDRERGVVVLFGGRNHEDGDLSDVWEWDGNDWEEKRPSYSPPVRCCHGAFYDSQRGKVVVYGGLNGGDNFLNDAWGWDGSEWTFIELAGERPLASGRDMINFEAADYTVLMPNWILQEDSWTTQQFEVAPSKRRHDRSIYDPVREQIILFGGLIGEETVDDTWLLTQDGWEQLDLSLSPSSRHSHVMFYDQVRERIVLFGGTGEEALNDMWELSLSSE